MFVFVEQDKLEIGIFTEETKSYFLEIIDKMKARERIDSVILGCAEFPIMFTESQYSEMPFLNTTGIHVKEMIKECLKE